MMGKAGLPVSDLHDQFSRDASLLAHMIDIASDQVLLSPLSEQDYKNASFLDRRILTPGLKWQAVKWDALDGVKIPENLPPYYIFHIGHVGSTLISRLLGESPDVLALREPQILRDFAEIHAIKLQPHSPWRLEQYNNRFSQMVNWLSRTFREDQRAMIKASSFVSNLASDLIGPENKSLFLYVRLESYLETILAGEGSRKEAEMLADLRLSQLSDNLGVELGNAGAYSHVQKIALGWLSGMTTLMETYEQKGDGLIRWQDFNQFLRDPKSELAKISNHFGLTLPNIDALIAGPIMNKYSKDPSHDYSPDLRKQLLLQARTNFSTHIKEAIDWVDTLANDHKPIEKILKFVE